MAKLKVLVSVALMSFGALAGDDGAITYTWQGAEGAVWASSANWSANPSEGAFGYPDGVNTTMKFTGSATVDGEGGTYNVKDGSFAAGTTVVLSSMTLKANPPASNNDFCGTASGGSSFVLNQSAINVVSGTTRLRFRNDGIFEFRNGSTFSGQYIDLWGEKGCKLIVRDNGTSLKCDIRWNGGSATDAQWDTLQVINSVFEVTSWRSQNSFNGYNLILLEQGGRIIWDSGFTPNAAFPIAIQVPAEGTTADTVPFYSKGDIKFSGNLLRIDATACTTAGTHPLVSVAANKTLTVTDGMLSGAEITTAEGFSGQLLLSEDGKTINLLLVDTTIVTPPTKIGPCTAMPTDDGELLVSGTLSSIGIGQTTVSIVYSCGGSEGTVSNVIKTAQAGDADRGFSTTIPAGYGNVVYWQIVSSNGTEDEMFSDETELTRTVASAKASTYTWAGADGAATWERAENWNATVTEGANPWPRGTSADVKFVDVADVTVTMDGTERETGTVSVEGGKLTIDQNQGDWRLAGGTKGLTVKDADLTVMGGREGCDFASSGITLAATAGGTVSPVSVAFDQVAVSTQKRPVFNTAGAPAQFWLKNGATVAFTGDDSWKMPAGSVFRASGAGSKITFTGNGVRWATNLSSDWRWLAEDGGIIKGEAFFYIGSANDTRDVVLTAVNGGSLQIGGGNNRTYFRPGGIVVAATNNGEVAFGAAAAGTEDRTSHSRFLVKNGKVTGNLNLGEENVFDVMGDESGESKLGTITYGASSASNRISVVGGRIGVDNLLNFNGTGNEVLLKDVAGANGGFPGFAGRDNQLILDNAVLTNKANFCAFDDIVNAPGCALVFRGETPRLYVEHDQSGVCAELGSTAAQTDPVSLIFEPKGNGFERAPLDVTFKAARMRPYLSLRVKTKGYHRMSRYDLPLIAANNWKEKPTAEEIESHLPVGALPKDAHLLWQGNTLCVNMPPAGGLMLLIR